MKKALFVLAAVTMLSLSFSEVNAQTKMGEKHYFSLGLHYGYGVSSVANLGGINFDINGFDNNFRVRVDLDCLQRPVGENLMAVGAKADAQYLIPIVSGEKSGFYIYPSVGLGAEAHDISNWSSKQGLGFNAGAGIEYQINGNVGLFVEGAYLYRFGTENYITGMVGIAFGL